MKRNHKNMLKLLGAGTFLAGFGWALIIAGPEGAPKDAEADIVRNIPKRAIYGDGFGEIVANSGIPPRAYKVNDNTIYFAVGHTSMSPNEVLDEYQERFFAAGINKKKYTQVPNEMFEITPNDLLDEEKRKNIKPPKAETLDYLGDMMMGGVVPLQIEPNYVSMGGMVPKHSARVDKRVEEIFEAWKPGELSSLGNGGKGFRFIDAQRIDEKLTRVTSVWADDDFDFRKMDNPDRYAVAQQTSAPRCPGCRVAMEMDSMQTNEPYTSSSYAAPNGDVNQLRGFYKDQMLAQGWKLSDSSKVLDYVRQHYPKIHNNTATGFLHFTRGKQDLTVSITPNINGETRVHSFQRKP